jgi:PAS domain S-box-containing protein
LFPTSVNLSVLRDLKGNPYAIIAVHRDVTERKKTEEKLKESENRFRRVFDASASAIFIADPKTGKLIDVNKSAEHLVARTRKELIGMHQTKLHPPDKVKYYAEKFKKHVKLGKTGDFEASVITKKGKEIPVFISASVTPIGGKPVIIGAFSDISGLKKAEEKIRESEERYRAIVENSTDYIFTLDKQYRFIAVNKAIANLSRKSADELIGKSISTIFPKETADRFSKNIKEVFETGRSKFIEEKMTAQGRESYINTSLNPIKDDTGKVTSVTGITRDITDRKKAEDALKESEQKWSSLAANAPNVMIITDKNGTIQFINRTVAGYSAKKVIGKKLYDYIDKRHHTEVKKIINKVLKTGRGSSYEIVGKGAHGKDAWYRTYVGPIKVGGKITALSHITSDITELKQMKKQLMVTRRNPKRKDN